MELNKIKREKWILKLFKRHIETEMSTNRIDWYILNSPLLFFIWYWNFRIYAKIKLRGKHKNHLCQCACERTSVDAKKVQKITTETHQAFKRKTSEPRRGKYVYHRKWIDLYTLAQWITIYFASKAVFLNSARFSLFLHFLYSLYCNIILCVLFACCFIHKK